MNVQPQSRPFVTGPRPAHHQFLHRAQMQTARPTIPTNSPSIRPSSQTPAAAVYPPNQPIMMTMTPVPFPSPQAAQYYIPQYRHSTPYVGPPQQYSVQPPGTGTFYPGPGPGEYSAAYGESSSASPGPPYYPGQTVYPASPPIIVPTPQQPLPAKREKKPIRIRDPNQGGKDITEEIMSGSRNPTPPGGRPSFTPTPPEPSSSSQTPEQPSAAYSVETPPQPSAAPTDVRVKPVEDKPKLESGVQKSSPPPGLGPSTVSTERREAPSLPVSDTPLRSEPEPLVPPPSTPTLPGSNSVKLSSAGEHEELQPATTVTASPSQSQIADTDQFLTEPSPSPSASPSPPLKAVNGLAESPAPSPNHEEELYPEEPTADSLPSLTQVSVLTMSSIEDPREASVLPSEELRPEPLTTTPSPGPVEPPSLMSSLPSNRTSVLAPPPGLPPLLQPAVSEALEHKTSDTNNAIMADEATAKDAQDAEDSHSQCNFKDIDPTAQTPLSAPKSWKTPNEESPQVEPPQKEKEEGPVTEDTTGDQASESPAETCSSTTPVPDLQDSKSPVPEENGETEQEPLRNGAGHVSETESSDSGITSGEREGTTVSHPYILQEEPVQANGKRQYDRDFLLGFQFMPACVQKPEGLPQISDVVLDKINQNKPPMRAVDPRVISRGPDFTPAFADFSRQISGGRGAALISVGVRRPQPRKIIMNVSVNDEVQLKKAENAWKPGMKRESVTEDTETQKTQELFRKVRSILNKLTPQMFNQLMKQVTDLTINTEERLKGVIDLVFEKAIDEPSFSVAYANMCRCLATLKVPMTDKPGTTVNFRKLLLNRCQKEFERDKVDDVVFERKQKELDSATSASEREQLQEELEEAKDKARRRSTGNIKFIGELFKLKMLTEPIMHDCVVKLLKNHDDESLECLCRLLTTIGKDLDFEKAKPRMDQYFNQMEKIVKERKTSSRIRFMLQDVIDLRLHNWVSRRADQGPKTIEQIHKEAKIEEQEEQRKVHQQLQSKDSKRRPDQRDQRSQREDTWNTVPMTKNSRAIDPTKIPKISKPQIDDKIQLGPRAQVNWMKGSSGGAKASDTELSRSGGSSLNRYSALQSSTPQPTTGPAQSPESDPKRALGSRGSSGRERNEKPLISGVTRPGPFRRGSSNKELTESVVPEESHREEPNTQARKASLSEDKNQPEHNKAKEHVKSENLAAVAPVKPVLSEEEMERKSKSIIDEFLHINDYKEAIQCVDELDHTFQLSVFVRMGVESTLERSQIARDHIGQLFFQLIQRGILPHTQIFKGFTETLELADDMAIDIPHIWLYLAELLNPLLREGGISMRELFTELSKPLLPVGRAGILFSEILHILCKQMSHRKVGALWREAGLSWSDFLPEGEDVQNFISEHKLQFTVSDCSSVNPVPVKRNLSVEELTIQLERLLLEDMASDEQIFDWVEANLDESQMSSSPFLRALMTAVCKAAVKNESSSCRVDTTIIQKRLPVLHKYLNSDTERQLQALYALQALIVTLDQPPNLLRMFFDCLYDEDVISEDAFYKWESSKDPAEQLGKGVALKSVTAFFTWLREAEEESEDN
ncbi:eukaryotic translation initiation factor 4 gamma 3 [Chanos chanos]|uniref:Eukaryotic translation initiation factor 4 gamma 3 n=1 Tax=Chanos chanos TaxID=29144 RepID=A0A6J2VQY3_CHACN|nr:eukaryotic translation initiation factor 4 gamma 3-like [Chanos chanos]